MDNSDFISRAAALLAQSSPEQRAQLATMVQSLGSTTQTGAMDRGISRPMVIDEANLRRDDPDYGKSIEERFPNLNRLKY